MSLNGTVWAPIGPSPIDEGTILANGQVTAIAVHPVSRWAHCRTTAL